MYYFPLLSEFLFSKQFSFSVRNLQPARACSRLKFLQCLLHMPLFVLEINLLLLVM